MAGSRPLQQVSIGLLAAISFLGSASSLRSDEPGQRMPAEVRAILAGKCLSCHNAETRKGGLDLSTRERALEGGESGPALEPGVTSESLLFEKIGGGEMPPKKRLETEEVAHIERWIAEGGEYDEGKTLSVPRADSSWWSLQPIKRPELPAAQDQSWCRNAVDRFVLAKLEASGLSPSPEADRATLLRRLSFDLTGLPPSPEEVAAFLADDSPLAYERQVDRLLDSPRFGERWGRHWLDVVRFAESHGYETNQLRPNAWPYRDYVIRAFNDDLPFARFVADQLAGDTRPETEADWLSRAATGFLVGGAHDVVGNQTPEGKLQQRADDIDDMVTATATAFLGLTVNCARCHDHKFDPISQRDYYGLAAVFSGVQHADRELPAADGEERRQEAAQVRAELAGIDLVLDHLEPLANPTSRQPSRLTVNYERNLERFEPVEARFLRFTTRATSNGIEPCIDELEVWTAGENSRNVALAATPSASSVYPNSDIHRLEHVNDGKTGNSRSWISNEAGQGWVMLELPAVETIDRVAWGRDRLGNFRDRLPVDYLVEVATEPGQWQVIASSADRVAFDQEKKAVEPAAEDALSPETRKRAELLALKMRLRTRLEALSPTIKVYAGTFSTPEPTYLLRRGDPTQPGDPVAPAGVTAVAPALVLSEDAAEALRRQELADWIADPGNPLPARVMVNRLWHYHFGQGIVSTPSDFGFNGGAPSHPELLDWLAAEFLAGDGRLKPLHRLIVLSAAYRQSSVLNPRASEIDAGNRLLWRFAPRRLEAEAIRDATLAISGALDTSMGGPGYWIWEENTNYVVVFNELDQLGPEHFRRMVYQYRPRSRIDPTFGAFDCPDGGLVAPRRNSSTTALQALNLLNSPFLLDQSKTFADRLKREAGDAPQDQVKRAFALAFGRTPTAREQEAAVALIQSHGTPAFCRALYNANEFLYMP